MVQPNMRKVGIWVSGLLASAIPFIFVGAVIAFLACVFDAVGEHAPTVRSRASIQAEAMPPVQVVAVASAGASDDVDQRQAGKRDHHARRSRSQYRREAHLGGQWENCSLDSVPFCKPLCKSIHQHLAIGKADIIMGSVSRRHGYSSCGTALKLYFDQTATVVAMVVAIF